MDYYFHSVSIKNQPEETTWNHIGYSNQDLLPLALKLGLYSAGYSISQWKVLMPRTRGKLLEEYSKALGPRQVFQCESRVSSSPSFALYAV